MARLGGGFVYFRAKSFGLLCQNFEKSFLGFDFAKGFEKGKS
jgi:hypothetical protein